MQNYYPPMYGTVKKKHTALTIIIIVIAALLELCLKIGVPVYIYYDSINSNIFGYTVDPYFEPSEPPDSFEPSQDPDPYAQDDTDGNEPVDAWDSSVSYSYTMEIYEKTASESDSNPNPTDPVSALFSSDGLDFHIEYPQLHGLNPGLEQEINQTIRDEAMYRVTSMYLEPGEDMQNYLREYADKHGELYLASTVQSTVTYNNENFISIAFVDHYFVGSIFAEYEDLRAININLLTGETYYAPNDIINVQQSFAEDWVKRNNVQNGSLTLTERVPTEDLTRILANDREFANRYFSVFFVNYDGNINVAITYRYSDEELIVRGWAEVICPYDELRSIKTESSFWKIDL